MAKRFLISIYFLCLSIGITVAQTRQITGKVTALDSGETLPAVTVVAQGSTTGTVTDIDGEFTLSISSQVKAIVFTYVGYESKTIDLKKEENFYAVQLNEDNVSLNEVVVVAGGIQRIKRSQGYAATKINADELTAGKPTNIAAGLTAKIPGLQINAITSGVNPNYRVVLRGNRSLTGNNQALIVVDNAIVTSDLLNNLNPEDIENIQVLNGASGATLYGSEASNGVLLVTTKKGKQGKPVVKIAHTITAEQVSFLPKLQNRFGAGSTADAQIYTAWENQQYGPAFDGSIRNLGYPLENGNQQTVLYSPTNAREDFWETGLQNQTDVSVSFGNDRSTTYLSGQYLDATGTTPGDKYNRASVRLNGTHKILSNLNTDYSASYMENNYDITNSTSIIYEDILNVPANIPLTDYKDLKNNPYASPDGWFNPWYENPYWIADTHRRNTKNSYLTGKVEIKYSPLSWLYVLYRGALNKRYYEDKSWTPKFTYSKYSQEEQGKTNLSGSVADSHLNKSRANHDFQLGLDHDLQDFSFSFSLGYAYSTYSEKYTEESASALVIPGLYNISNRVGEASVNQYNKHYINLGLWGDFLVGYKNYLFLHVTGRNDYTSLLRKENRSYFYPSVDLSFIPTDAIASLQNNSFLNYLKLRGALSKTGNVNIDPYALDPTFSSVTGYSKGTYYSQDSKLVSTDLKPEITKGSELGLEFRLLNNRIDGQASYYYTSTTGQAIEAGISPSSGYSTYLINTGEVTNRGVELALHFTPIKTADWELTLGGNYTHNKNRLVTLFENDNPNDRISINGSSVIYAQEGYELNQIIVTDYNRDDKGRVIVDANTGYPSIASETKIIGNTTPKHRLGLDLQLKWKDFTLSTLFEYRGGYSAAAISLGSNLDFTGSSARSAYYNRERFVFPNSSYLDPTTGKYVDNTNVTVSDGGSGFWTTSTYNRGVYSNYVYSADYWKWRELSLSYQVSKKFIQKLAPLQAASVSFQARNLILWASSDNDYTDPDYSANDNNAIGVSTLSQTPPTRYFGGTISLTF